VSVEITENVAATKIVNLHISRTISPTDLILGSKDPERPHSYSTFIVIMGLSALVLKLLQKNPLLGVRHVELCKLGHVPIG